MNLNGEEANKAIVFRYAEAYWRRGVRAGAREGFTGTR
jgi:hypothetical protein